MKNHSLSFFAFTICLFFLTGSKAYTQNLKNLFNNTFINKNNTVELPYSQDQIKVFIKEDYQRLSDIQNMTATLKYKGVNSLGIELASSFRGIQVHPLGQNYMHLFWYVSGKTLTQETKIMTGKNFVFIPEEAKLLPFSSETEVKSFFLPDAKEMQQPWVIPLYNDEKEATNANFDLLKSLYYRAKSARRRGAVAVVFYDQFGLFDLKSIDGNQHQYTPLDIPVLVLNNKAYEEKIKPTWVISPFYLNIRYKNEYSEAANIIGYINNNAKEDVVISAGYESRIGALPNDDPKLAEVTSMLTLARLINKSKFKRYNYIFCAFPQNGYDQIGALNLLKDKNIGKSKIAYVIELNRISEMGLGRNLKVDGVLSSPVWIPYFQKPIIGIKYQFGMEDTEDFQSSNAYIFNQEQIPILSFSTESPKKNQTEKFNVSEVKDISILLYRLITELENQLRPKFADAQQREQNKKLLQQVVIPSETTVVNPPVNTPKAPVSGKATPPPSVSKNETTKAQESQVKKGANQQKFPRYSQQQSLSDKAKGADIQNETIAAHAQIFEDFGIVNDAGYKGNGVRIFEVKKDELADRAGLKRGDIILEVNKKKINDYNDLSNFPQPAGQKDGIVIKLQRGVTVQEYTLKNL